MPPTHPPLIDRTAALLRQADHRSLDGLVTALLADGSSAPALLDDLLSPALRLLGSTAGSDEARAALPRAAPARAQTAAAERVLARLAPAEPGSRGRLVLATFPADPHRLPGRVAAQRLRHEGWHVDETALAGGRTATGQRTGEDPVAVLVSVTLSAQLLACADTIRAIHIAGHRVLVGGRAFGADGAAARAVGADGWGPDAVASGAVLEAWAADPAPTALCRPAALREARELERIGHRLAAQIAGEVVGAAARSRAEARAMAGAVRTTIDVVGAATFAGADVLEGHAGRLGALGYGGDGEHFCRGVLGALRRALPAGCTAAAAVVDAALAARALSPAGPR
ncbi:hypothetical protein NBH00_20235 [Paraconexibacter antarcticus]|uniref:B12-binding domain-containing protein n=1 Tax=Paraconexibacter antarcticus TaxID=2949664 RepID=A0ABY5DRW7_9ACTN|nr:hypothetical protein [Paraconexibacter antarcticus]UTI63659.1 hypothetical protein NBH00_20235 [Paraconexibacter antarcticus]